MAGWCRRSRRAPISKSSTGLWSLRSTGPGSTSADLDGIAAAAGPGLIGGVMVGLTTAKALALASRKPFLAINHLEAHALTARLTDELAFPYLLLLVSGGHTQLVAVKGVGDYLRLGSTVDDAAGEAFDKVGKMLGLPYPGGPAGREAMAGEGNAARFDLPRPMLGRPKPDFSFSGLKTAVRLEVERAGPLTAADVADVCASFQAAVVDAVIDRCRAGLRLFRETVGHPNAMVVAGGVAANGAIRRVADAVLRRGRVAARLAAAQSLHRQWRDDRLGGDRAALAGARRRSDLCGAAALAARRQCRSRASRQGLTG